MSDEAKPKVEGLETVPPLYFDGTTIFIDRASASQAGYVSKEDFAFFLGLGMGVTQINTGQGLVGGPITSVGTIAIATVPGVQGVHPYPSSITLDSVGRVTAISSGSSSGAFLPLEGGTLTGPLVLSRDPISALEAATRAYVLANANPGEIRAVRGEWYVTDYNASGSVTRFTGAITSGTKILTLTTSAHDFQVGQGICILGAGSIPTVRGNVLVSLITAISGAQITIQDNATATATTATVDNVQHDDTDALQTAINAVLNETTGGGTLIFPDGYYRINKGFTDYNSILKIPYVSPYWASKTILLKGVSPWRGAFLGPISTTGTIIKTELINTSGSMFSGGVYNGPNADIHSENITSIWMERITWVTYDNPQINGLDFGMLGQFLQLKEVQSVTDAPTLGGSEPTHNTFAIRLPQNSFSATTLLDLVIAAYHTIGVIASEQVDSWRLYISRCKIALQFQPGYHLSRGHITPFQCARLIDIPGTAPGYPDIRLDLTMDIEVGGDPWMLPDPAGEVYDPNNAGKGKLRYVAMVSNSGALTTITKTGGSYLEITRIT